MAFLLALLPVEAKAKYSVGTFEAGKGCFMLNGKPFVVKAAELHYPRIPRPYWEHRIKMCKALGMNTICIYIFWNKHEQEEGKFDWTDGAFIIAKKHGAYSYVTLPNDVKIYTIEEFQHMFIMN